MMMRTLCCNRAKVADTKEAIRPKNDQHVIIIAKAPVILQQLVGRLLETLENQRLVPVNIRIYVPKMDDVHKSTLTRSDFKKTDEVSDPWLFLDFRGPGAVSKVDTGLRGFRHKYSIEKHDIYFTDNTLLSDAEGKIWFPEPTPSTSAPVQENGKTTQPEIEAPPPLEPQNLLQVPEVANTSEKIPEVVATKEAEEQKPESPKSETPPPPPPASLPETVEEPENNEPHAPPVEEPEPHKAAAAEA